MKNFCNFFCNDYFKDLLASITFAKSFGLLVGVVSKIILFENSLQSKNQFLRNAFAKRYLLRDFTITIAHKNFKSNQIVHSLLYAKACNELAGPISASLHLGNIAPFEEMPQRWRAVGNTVSDLTSPRFEPQTSCSRNERVTARPTGWFAQNLILEIGGKHHANSVFLPRSIFYKFFSSNKQPQNLLCLNIFFGQVKISSGK